MATEGTSGDGRPPVLELRDVQVHYSVRAPGEGRTRRRAGDVTLYAVDGVSFAIGSGETMGLIGESGSGKSTLARVITGLIRPTSGQVLVQGRDISDPAVLRDTRGVVQMIFQNPRGAVNPRRRVGQIVTEPMRVQRMGKPESRMARARELIELVGLPADVLDRYPNHLSGGQLQRVGIARALSTNPELLVADEPTASLDASVRAQVMNLLRDLQGELGIAILFISHDLGSVSYLADRLSVMYLGRVVEGGHKESVESLPSHPYTRSLLASASVVGGEAGGVVAGEVPSAVNRPSGCHFHPRCPVKVELCLEEYPEETRVTPDHTVRCHVAQAALRGVGHE